MDDTWDLASTVPYYCESCRTYHASCYYINGEGKYWTGDRGEEADTVVAKKDLPTAAEIKAAWKVYFKDCVRLGEDPLEELLIPKIDNTWTFRVKDKRGVGPVVAAVRLNDGSWKDPSYIALPLVELHQLGFSLEPPNGLVLKLYKTVKEFKAKTGHGSEFCLQIPGLPSEEAIKKHVRVAACRQIGWRRTFWGYVEAKSGKRVS